MNGYDSMNKFEQIRSLVHTLRLRSLSMRNTSGLQSKARRAAATCGYNFLYLTLSCLPLHSKPLRRFRTASKTPGNLWLRGGDRYLVIHMYMQWFKCTSLAGDENVKMMTDR